MLKRDKAIALFETVRDIPYGSINSRDPGQVLAHRMGTCSGKHLLLASLLQAIEVPVKMIMCRTFLDQIQVELPPDIRNKYSGQEIPDFHNYLRVEMGDGWLNVDATFDLPLREYGLVVNEWNGTDNCRIAVPVLENREVEDLLNEKEAAILALPPGKQHIRQSFIRDFSRWLETVRG